MPVVLPPVQLGPLTWDWSRTCIFGVVNVTPDSFSDGGRYLDPRRAVDHGLALVEQGADVLDVGGESTRPRADPVAADEELRRVLPVIEQLAGRLNVPISVDTYKAEVARAALAGGACIVNDISGLLLDDGMVRAVAEHDATVILGHLRGEPRTMQRDIGFVDVKREVTAELRDRVRSAVTAGVRAERIWIDPGIGFGKTAQQSLALINSVGRLREALGYPVLVGPSRKSFLGAVTGLSVDERVYVSGAAAAAAVMAGADAVRLHDVQQLAPAVRVADAIRRERLPVETAVAGKPAD